MINTYENLQKLSNDNIDNYDIIEWVKINGTNYRKDDVLNVGENNLIIFGKIEYIITNYSATSIIYKKIKSLNYNKHFRAYEIEEEEEYDLIMNENLKDYKVYNFYVLNKKRYISFSSNKYEVPFLFSLTKKLRKSLLAQYLFNNVK